MDNAKCDEVSVMVMAIGVLVVGSTTPYCSMLQNSIDYLEAQVFSYLQDNAHGFYGNLSQKWNTLLKVYYTDLLSGAPPRAALAPILAFLLRL